MSRWFLGPLDDEILKATFEAIAQRHSALRTRFVVEDKERFTQWVEPTLPTDFFYVLPASSDAEARMVARAQLDLPMDVTRGVLRVRVIRTAPERALMVMVLHTVADGWSSGFCCEFTARNARMEGSSLLT